MVNQPKKNDIAIKKFTFFFFIRRHSVVITIFVFLFPSAEWLNFTSFCCYCFKMIEKASWKKGKIPNWQDLAIAYFDVFYIFVNCVNNDKQFFSCLQFYISRVKICFHSWKYHQHQHQHHQCCWHYVLDVVS